MTLILRCPHCQTDNSVNKCTRCDRHFILSKNRVSGQRRTYDDSAIVSKSSVDIQPCDYCLSKDDTASMQNHIESGLRQKTCPNCHTEMLSYHGIEK